MFRVNTTMLVATFLFTVGLYSCTPVLFYSVLCTLYSGLCTPVLCTLYTYTLYTCTLTGHRQRHLPRPQHAPRDYRRAGGVRLPGALLLLPDRHRDLPPHVGAAQCGKLSLSCY